MWSLFFERVVLPAPASMMTSTAEASTPASIAMAGVVVTSLFVVALPAATPVAVGVVVAVFVEAALPAIAEPMVVGVVIPTFAGVALPAIAGFATLGAIGFALPEVAA